MAFELWSLVVCLAVGLAVGLGGCHDDRLASEGEACAADDECLSGFCWAGCREGAADDDGDGLVNSDERRVGTSPTSRDTDRDGVSDPDELGSGGVRSPRDRDGDGVIDAIESGVADGDGDCLPDELDGSGAKAGADELVEAMCRSAGLCDGRPVTARCEDTIICDYGQVPGFEAAEASCDGRDNDCDGQTDEGLVYLESTGEAKRLGETCVGLGACAEKVGVVECSDAGGVVCSVDRAGSEPGGDAVDIDCDGVDNDCDGQTDEGIGWIEPGSGTVKRFGEPCFARGACGLVTGLVECAGDGFYGVCSTEPGASGDKSFDEVCNGADDDCDGRTDEGLTWRDDRGPMLSVGEPCGRGVCSGGVVSCAGGVAVCPGLAQATPEVCNALDDDCDGTTDEVGDVVAGCGRLGVCGEVAVRAECVVDDGGAPREPGEPMDFAARSLVCLYGAEGWTRPEVELSCDGRDDDCDGLTDEDFWGPDVEAGGEGGDGGTSAATTIGEPCLGSGLCATVGGFFVCAADGRSLVCSADAGSAEVCDGVDNDCDGSTDEDAVGAPACPEVGVCAAAIGEGVCSGAQWVCPADALGDFQAVESGCDELDNDCDGVTDEGEAREPTGGVVRLGGGPPDRAGFVAAVEPPGVAWVFGGIGTGAAGTAVLLGDLWRFDEVQGWREVPVGGTAGTGGAGGAGGAGEPPARGGHAVVWEPRHSRLLVHGGFEALGATRDDVGDDGEGVSSMWAFEPRTGTWQVVEQKVFESVTTGTFYPAAVADRILARRWHTVSALGDGRLVLHGGVVLPGTGRTGGVEIPVTLVGELVPATGREGALLCRWRVLAGEGLWRWGHSAAAFDWDGESWVVLSGGFGGAGVSGWELVSVATGQHMPAGAPEVGDGLIGAVAPGLWARVVEPALGGSSGDVGHVLAVLHVLALAGGQSHRLVIERNAAGEVVLSASVVEGPQVGSRGGVFVVDRRMERSDTRLDGVDALFLEGAVGRTNGGRVFQVTPVTLEGEGEPTQLVERVELAVPAGRVEATLVSAAGLPVLAPSTPGAAAVDSLWLLGGKRWVDGPALADAWVRSSADGRWTRAMAPLGSGQPAGARPLRYDVHAVDAEGVIWVVEAGETGPRVWWLELGMGGAESRWEALDAGGGEVPDARGLATGRAVVAGGGLYVAVGGVDTLRVHRLMLADGGAGAAWELVGTWPLAAGPLAFGRVVPAPGAALELRLAAVVAGQVTVAKLTPLGIGDVMALIGALPVGAVTGVWGATHDQAWLLDSGVERSVTHLVPSEGRATRVPLRARVPGGSAFGVGPEGGLWGFGGVGPDGITRASLIGFGLACP